MQYVNLLLAYVEQYTCYSNSNDEKRCNCIGFAISWIWFYVIFGVRVVMAHGSLRGWQPGCWQTGSRL